MKIGLYRNLVGTLPKDIKAELRNLDTLSHRIRLGEFILEKGRFIGNRSTNESVYEYNKQFYYIFDVDTTRPWRITDYDGLEYVQYLDYTVIDEELNYCELKGD